jgi:ATP-dependent DNA ligase
MARSARGTEDEAPIRFSTNSHRSIFRDLRGYYAELIYVARIRNGFVPATRRQVFAKLRPLVTPACPFANLPETHKGRWGTWLTADDMKKCVWVLPQVVAQIEYLECTESGHLRHAKFIGLRNDMDARRLEKSTPEKPQYARIPNQF